MKRDVKKIIFRDGDVIKTARGKVSFKGKFVVVRNNMEKCGYTKMWLFLYGT